MTKQVIIKKDGVSSSESVDLINTMVSGGAANWMPEDEAIAGSITITSNGEYVPSEYGLYGFWLVNVLVSGGAGAEITPSNGGYPTFVTPTPASEPNASVIGVDPSDGAIYRVEVQDVDGVLKLVRTKVADSKGEYKPTAIRVLMKPAKLSYDAGDEIQYAGLVVQLIDSTEHTFVDERFPQGIISWSNVESPLHPEYNLITPVKYAPSLEDGDVSNNVYVPVQWNSPYDNQTYEDTFDIEVNDA